MTNIPPNSLTNPNTDELYKIIAFYQKANDDLERKVGRQREKIAALKGRVNELEKATENNSLEKQKENFSVAKPAKPQPSFSVASYRPHRFTSIKKELVASSDKQLLEGEVWMQCNSEKVVSTLSNEKLPEKKTPMLIPTSAAIGNQTINMGPGSSILDEFLLRPGEEFEWELNIKNQSAWGWPEGCKIAPVGVSCNRLSIQTTRIPSEARLLSGEEGVITLKGKAPLEEGIHMSYWRASDCNGTHFGKRLRLRIRVIEKT